MRQAFVIKNPKWELFDKASDAFKASDAPAILVVRGRCKEKKIAKTLVKLTKSAVAALVLVLGVSAQAQQDITVMLPTLELAGATTNAGPGSGVLGWNRDQIAVLGANIYSSNIVHIASKSNVVVRFDASANGTDWATNAYGFSLTTATFQTNGNASIGRLTNSLGAKWLRLGAVENSNSNRVYIQRVSFSIDP